MKLNSTSLHVARKSSRPTPLWLAISIASILSPLLGSTANAAITASWSGTGNWSDPTKWSTNPTVPGAIDDIAQLPSTSTGDGITTLDTPGIIVGTLQNITPAGIGRTWTINASGGNVLTMEVSTGSALINVTSNVTGTLTINPAIVTNSNLIIRATGNDGQTQTININNGLTGTGDVTTDFAGSGGNASSNISISSLNTVGTLTAQGNKSANGTKTTTIATVGSNVTSVTKTGTSTLVLSGINSHTGATTVSGGTLRVSGASSLPTGSLLTLNGGTLEFNRSTAVVQGVDFSTGAIIGSGGGGGLTHNGSGTLELNAANTFSGGATTVGSSGDLILKNALAVQNSTLTRTGAGNIIFDSASGTAWTVGGLGGAGALALLDNAGVPNALTLTISGNGSNGNISGAISGTGATITKNGANTQTFSGGSANTYTGLTTVTAGTLSLAKTATVNSIGASGVLVNGTGTLDNSTADNIDNAATVEVATGGVWGKGGGTVAETVGTVILSGGTLGVSGGGNLTVTAGTLDLRTGTQLNGRSALAGSGLGFTKNTAGTLTLGGSNTFDGAVSITDGVVVANSAGVAGTSGPLGKGATTVSGTGRLDANVTSSLLGSSAITVTTGGELRATAVVTPLATGSGIKIGLNGGTIRGFIAQSATLGGNVNVTADSTIVNERSGTASATSMTLTFGTLDIGANTLHVRSTDNQTGGTSGVAFTTTTTTGNAVFDIAKNPALTNTTQLSLGALTLGGSTIVQGTGAFTQAGAVNLGGADRTITFNNSGANSFGGGALSSSGANDKLTFAGSANVTVAALTGGTQKVEVNGSGTYLFNGASTYTGDTTITAGVARASLLGVAATSGPLGKGATIINGGRVESTLANALLGSSAITVNTGGELRGITTAGTLNTASGVKIGVAGGTVRMQGAGTTTFGGNLNVTADSTVINERTSSPSATSMTQTLGTLDIGSNTLNVQSTNNQTGGTAGVTFTGTTTTGNAVFNVTNNAAANDTTLLTLGALTLGGNTTVQGSGAFTQTGAISLGGANRTITFNNSGANNISGGALSSSGANDKLIFAGTANVTVAALTGGTQGVEVNGTAATASTLGTTVTFSGANTYTGATTVTAGTLTITNAGTFTNTSGITLASGGRLNVNVTSQSLAKLASPTGSGVVAGSFLRYSTAQTAAVASNGPGTILGTVELNLTNVNPNYTLDFGLGSKLTNVISATFNAPITLSGNMTIETPAATILTLTNATAISGGANAITKTGDGTLTLSNSGVTAFDFSGGLGINAGTLANNLNSGGLLTVGSGAVTFANGTTYQSANNALANAVVLTSGTVNHTVSGNNGLSGEIRGTVTGSGGIASVVNGTGTGFQGLAFSGTGNSFSGGISLTLLGSNVSGGIRAVTTSALGTGLVTLNQGTLTIGGLGTGGSSAGTIAADQDIDGLAGAVGTSVIGNSNVGGGSTITISPSSGSSTFSGVIGGGGANNNNLKLVMNGASGTTQTLAGANTYSGGTTVNGGVLTVGTGGTLGATTGALAVNNPNVGAGTDVVLNLATAADTTTGSLSGAISTPSGGTNTATINNGGAGQNFTVNQTSAGDYAGVIAGAGTFTLGASSTNALTLSGANTYTGATSIAAGTLIAANAAALGTNAAGTTIASGATLDVQANIGTEAISVEGNGVGSNGALVTGTGSGTVGGAVTLTADARVGGAGSLTIAGAIGGAFQVTKVGAGTTTLSGAQNYTTLATNEGVTNVSGAFTGGTVNANATTNFTVSQTLSALNIGTVPLAGLGAAPAFMGGGAAVVPEPGSAVSLLGGLSMLLGLQRFRRRA